MNKITTPLNEVFILKPNVHLDERGSFMESFNEKSFKKAVGRKITFHQDNETFSKKGVIRGLHYQDACFANNEDVRA